MLPALLATPPQHRQINADTLPLILYAGSVASVVLPFFWIRGVEQLGPNRCAIFMNLLPVLTAGAAIATLGEPSGYSMSSAAGRCLRPDIPAWRTTIPTVGRGGAVTDLTPSQRMSCCTADRR
jgi:hypothetical protein